MSYRLHQRDIGVQHFFQNVLGVSGGCDSQDFQPCTLALHLPAQGVEHVLRILDRVSVGQLVCLTEDICFQGKQHSFCRGGSAIHAHYARHRLTPPEAGGPEIPFSIGFLEQCQLAGGTNQPGAAGFGLLLLASVFDVPEELRRSAVTANAFVLLLAELDCAQRSKVLRILGDFD